MSPEQIAAVVLAGGKARRLGGVDKPLLELGGTAMLARIIDALRADLSTIAVSANGIYVASNGGPHITRYSSRANGNAPPRSLLNVSATGGITAAPDGSIYAAGLGRAAIYQYAANAKRMSSTP